MFQKGEVSNPKGRPKGTKNKWSVTALEKAFAKAAKTHGKKNILEHLADKAYNDNNLAIALLKKMMPDLKSFDAFIGILEGSVDESTLDAIRTRLKTRLEQINNMKEKK